MNNLNIGYKTTFNHLKDLFQSSPEIAISDSSKIVIFSDLHLGDGGSNDDFKPNSHLFAHILEHYYLKKDFSLILNGDIEELQKFKFSKIRKAWDQLYNLFDRFNESEKLYKTVGNHDLELLLEKGEKSKYKLYHGLKLNYNTHHIFIFHGHQANNKYLKYNKLLGITLKYLANPLGIKNFSVSHNSRKQYSIEKKVYHFSSHYKMVSVIGHTHRPLFESLSKVERLKFKIEQMCREYEVLEDEVLRKKIKKSIKNYKKELKKIHKKENGHLFPGNLYDSVFNIPCLFNSGCAIGKRGITTLEIEKGSISLVHWFDKNTSKKYLKNTGYDPQNLNESDYYRMVINTEKLNYIFTRIKLLA